MTFCLLKLPFGGRKVFPGPSGSRYCYGGCGISEDDGNVPEGLADGNMENKFPAGVGLPGGIVTFMIPWEKCPRKNGQHAAEGRRFDL